MKKKAKSSAVGKKKKKKRMSSHLRLFQLVAEHMMHINQAGKKGLMNKGCSGSSSSSRSNVMSTNDIMRMARSRLLQSKSENSNFLSVLIGGCSSSANSDTLLSDDLELAMLIHASAHKVYTGQFERARKLLSMCRDSSSLSGNTLQKLVFYFAEALHERITRELESNTVPSEKAEGNPRHEMTEEEAEEEAAAPTIIDVIQWEHYLPFCRIAEYTAMQYILDNVASAKKVHLIDLGIRIGSHWPILLQGLQALADQFECPLETLKLTAIGGASSKQNMEEIGMHLSSFAENMGIPFQFKVLVSELQNIKEDMFEIEPDEALAICSELRLSRLLAWPDQLENFLQTIENLHPKAFVTTEFDANTNTSDFIERFDEAINLASAVLDCIEDCLDGDTPCKAIIEHVFVREAIQNIITAEGEERVHRHQRIDTWRDMLAKHGFTEVPPSEFARNQAKILVNNNPRWSGCTVDSDGKCMIVGWRGNPIKSVSTWTSQHVV